MALYVLLNTIKRETGLLKSGTIVDSTQRNILDILSSGGMLILTSYSPVLVMAAQAVQGMWRDGKEQSVCDATMLAAFGAAGMAYEAAHDAVVAEATHTHSVSSVTPVITAAKVRLQQSFGALAAPGTNYVAQFAAGAAIDSAGPFARFVPSRTVQIVRGGAGNATVYTVDGTDPDGTALQEVLNSAGAATIQGTRAFATITRVRSNVDPGVTTDFQSGNGVGLAVVASDVDAVGVDGVLETPVSSHAATGTVVPTTVPNAAHTYAVEYRVLPTATIAAHDHGAATGAGSSHTHALS